METVQIAKRVGLAVGIFCFANCGSHSAGDNKLVTATIDTPKSKINQVKDNPYEDLRKMAFSTTPQQLKLSLPADRTAVYGIIMDWELGGGIATVVSYQTGDASVYLSSGGGYIGGGQHQNVSDASKKFISLSQSFLERAAKTDLTSLPGADEVKFYFLTNKGVFMGKENVKNFENDASPWLPLFNEGNIVLTELRKMTEKNQ
jgi:hypothetical protein